MPKRLEAHKMVTHMGKSFYVSPRRIRAALKARTPSEAGYEIQFCFTWHNTPQGFEFWNQRRNHGLDQKARSILQMYLDMTEKQK